MIHRFLLLDDIEPQATPFNRPSLFVCLYVRSYLINALTDSP